MMVFMFLVTALLAIALTSQGVTIRRHLTEYRERIEFLSRPRVVVYMTINEYTSQWPPKDARSPCKVLQFGRKEIGNVRGDYKEEGHENGGTSQEGEGKPQGSSEDASAPASAAS